MSGGHVHALHVHGHSPVHRLAPEVKVAAMVAFVVAVVATPRQEIWAFAVHGFFLVAVIAYAELPVGFVLRRTVVEVPFVLFALALPFLGGEPRVEILGVGLAREGLWSAWNILVKATLGVTASMTLVATTEIPDILRGLERLRVPRLVTAIAGFMMRYLEVILAELGRMRTSMIARGHDPRWLWQARPIAASAGALFVRSYERGERVHQAMASRGYDGSMPDLDGTKAGLTGWAAGMAVPLFAWLTALLAMVGG